MESTPTYVISEDTQSLFAAHARNESWNPPSRAFFNDITNELTRAVAETIGHTVELVPDQELRDGIASSVQQSKYPVISLDRAYVDASDVEGFLDITRGVDGEYNSLGQPITRPGSLPLAEQLESLRTAEVSPVVLVDDVIFEGNAIRDVQLMLAKVNRPVVGVIGGIVIQEGLSRLVSSEVDQHGQHYDALDVESVRHYDEVIDEICERDFYIGVPMSGRTLVTPTGEQFSAPYIHGYGKACEWASIPVEKSQQLAAHCIELSLNIWKETEQKSGVVIPANTIPRRVRELDSDRSIVATLSQVHSDTQVLIGNEGE